MEKKNSKSNLLKYIVPALVIAIMAALLIGTFSGCGIAYKNADNYTAGNTKITKKVENIFIDWESGKINLTTNKEDYVEVHEANADQLSDDAKVHWWLDGTTLRVKYAASGKTFHIGNVEKVLTVSVPEDFDLNDVSINSASAEISVDCIAKNVGISSASGIIDAVCIADSIDIGSSSGDIDATCVADNMNINSSSGNIDATVTAENINIESSSGTINLEQNNKAKAVVINSSSGDITADVEETEVITIETSSGKVHLDVPEKMGFTAVVDTSSGDFKSDFALVRLDDIYKNGDGTAIITIETSSGDIDLLKK